MNLLERSGRWIDAHPRASLASLAAFYGAIVSGQSALKLLWVDELITFYIARQPGLRGIWRALQDGADPNPPLIHLLVQGSTHLCGDGAFAVRLPAILCVLLALLAMWTMLRRWVRPVYALVGLLSFMATRGFDYAYDARSYAPMMGFTMAALALWMEAGDRDGPPRLIALTGMALALAAALSSNYYCVLAFAPIAAGELVTRRFRKGVWLALVAASLTLSAYLPLIRHNIAEFGPHAWNRPRASMVVFSYVELVEGIVWPVLGLGVWLLWKRRLAGSASQRPAEVAAIAVLLVYPVLGFAIALCGASMISPRCVAPVCCGFGLAAAVMAQRAFGHTARAGAALVLALLVWVGARQAVCAHLLLEQRRAFFALRDAVEQVGGDRILIADSSFALPFYFYASDRVTQERVVVPIDFQAIHRYEADDSGEQNLWAGRNGVFPFLITGVDEALLDSDETIVARPEGWLVKSLQAHGLTVTQVGSSENWDRVGGEFSPMAHFSSRLFVDRAGGAAR